MRVEADDVIVARPASIGAGVELAHALGNRHLPIQRDGDAIIVRAAARAKIDKNARLLMKQE